MTRHRHLAQRVDALDARTPDADTPALREAFWLMRTTMGLPQHIADRARELAAQAAPLPNEWPPRELFGAPEGEP